MIGKDLQGASWLDLCSGSGVMACEALQKGASRILAIEKRRETAKICKKNLLDVSNNLGHEFQIEVICKEIISFLKKGNNNQKIDYDTHSSKLEKRFDFVFLDPPYDSELYKLSQEVLISMRWVKKSSILICECSSKNLPVIDYGWKLNKLKTYGNTSILFLTPNQALNCFDDTDSMH